MLTTLILLVILGLTAWGILLGRQIRLVEYTSDRSRGTSSQLFFGLLSSLVGAWMFFGLVAVGYEAGIVGIAIGGGYALGLLLFSFFLSRIKDAMTQYDCDTMDDLIGARFGKRAQALVSAFNFLFFIAVVGAQFMAMFSFLRFIAPEMSTWLPPLAGTALIAYTASAGYKGVFLTDIGKALILIVGTIALAAVIAVNWLSAPTFLPTYETRPEGYGLVFTLGALLLFPLTLLARTDLWQRVAHARDAAVAKRAMLACAPVLFILYVIFTGIGMAARAYFGSGQVPETSGFALFQTLLDQNAPGAFGQILLALVILGVYAGLLSTADNMLNLGAIALSKLFFRLHWSTYSTSLEPQDRFTSPKLPVERALLLRLRLLTIGVGVTAFTFALSAESIVNAIVGAASMLMVLVPVVLASLSSRPYHPATAIGSLLVGMVGLALAMAFLNPKTAFLPAVVLATITFILIERFRRLAR